MNDFHRISFNDTVLHYYYDHSIGQILIQEYLEGTCTKTTTEGSTITFDCMPTSKTYARVEHIEEVESYDCYSSLIPKCVDVFTLTVVKGETTSVITISYPVIRRDKTTIDAKEVVNSAYSYCDEAIKNPAALPGGIPVMMFNNTVSETGYKIQYTLDDKNMNFIQVRKYANDEVEELSVVSDWCEPMNLINTPYETFISCTPKSDTYIETKGQDGEIILANTYNCTIQKELDSLHICSRFLLKLENSEDGYLVSIPEAEEKCNKIYEVETTTTTTPTTTTESTTTFTTFTTKKPDSAMIFGLFLSIILVLL